jgi:hypothetical protein
MKKINLRHTIFFLLFFALIGESFGQGFYNSNLWKRKRHELNFALGTSHFLGDLGGRDRIGSNFVWDLEFSKTRPVFEFRYLYYLGRTFAFRPQLSIAKVAGDDKLTAESFRNNRNLNFQSIVAEGALMFEWQFVKEKVGNVYNLKSNTGKKLGLKTFSLGFYSTFGVGAFYFNPKSTGPDGQLYELFPLRTEGQGLEGGPDPYKRVAICVPIGFGVKKSLSRTSGIKVELTHRFTFTDYIDDVSTVYYDRTVLSQNYGPLSAYFSNPQLGNKPPIVTQPGQQRGDPDDNDSYFYFTVSYYLTLPSKPSTFGRNKVRTVRASF